MFKVTRSRCSSGSWTVERAWVTCSGVTRGDFLANIYAFYQRETFATNFTKEKQTKACASQARIAISGAGKFVTNKVISTLLPGCRLEDINALHGWPFERA